MIEEEDEYEKYYNREPSFRRKLYRIITTPSGRASLATLDMYCGFRNLSDESVPINVETDWGRRVGTDLIQTSYEILGKREDCSSETVRRRLVALEKIRLVKRELITTEHQKHTRHKVLHIRVFKKYFLDKNGNTCLLPVPSATDDEDVNFSSITFL